jgi:hypothetical protein
MEVPAVFLLLMKMNLCSCEIIIGTLLFGGEPHEASQIIGWV